MNKIDKHLKEELGFSIFLIIFSCGLVTMGMVSLGETLNVNDELFDSVIHFLGFIILGVPGIILFVFEAQKIIKLLIRLKQINQIELENKIIYAHIDGAKSNNYGQDSVVCSAIVDGCECQFVSDQPVFDAYYAAKELGVEEVKVYISIKNPNEYVVDLRDLEERVVDLTR